LLIAKAVGFGDIATQNEISRDMDKEEKVLIGFMNKLKK